MMNGTAARFGAGLLSLVALGWILTGSTGQAAGNHFARRQQAGLPTDWTHQHMIFSRPRTSEQAARVANDPRYWQQWARRGRMVTLVDRSEFSVVPGRKSGGGLDRDWSESLGNLGSVGAGNYPAKYSFSLTTANCGNATTPDYVVYSTGLQSSTGQASIVAYDNLYAGCTGIVPSTYWAYNTTGAAPGTVMTSPVLSLDGTQVAFVQTDGAGHGTVVLLQWAANTGSVGSPAAPSLVAAGSYRGCTTPCMAQLNLRDRLNVQTDDQTSSVYYDYTNDVAWVGDSAGLVHQFHPFFLGTPTEVRNSLWPALVNGGAALTSAVYDRISGNVFVGDAGGYLYSVSSTTAAVTQSGQLDFGVGVEQSPVVDTLNQFVYVFASSDGSGDCAEGVDCAGVFQLTTTFGAGDTGSEASVGNSTFTGTPPNPLYTGSFDSAYYNSSNGTGNLYVCGNTGGNPQLWQVPIAAGVMPPTGLGVLVTDVGSTSSTAACSPVTDIPNATGTLSTERVLLGVEDNGVANGCSNAGCAFTLVSAPWTASTTFAAGQQILDSKLHIETVITAGRSGLTVPHWGTTAGGEKTDGSVVWINQGVLTARTLPGWVATHPYATNARIPDSNGYIEVATHGGMSGGSVPSWNTTPGGTTSDGSVTWTNSGALPSAQMQAAGGTSGIIEDNAVSTGVLAGTSQVYFSTLANQACGTSGTGGCAVQASQAALQ